jgi:hypothetical protein
MWYNGYNNVDRDMICYAKSEDGKSWVPNVEPLFTVVYEQWAKLWYQDIEVLCVNDVYQLWAYGRNGNYSWNSGAGVGYFTDSSNVTDVDFEEGFPQEFHLSQNYPNPFNPSTTIKYSIPVDSKQYTVGSRQYQESSIQHQVTVSLKVYDLLGRKVATLVNTDQRPGNYEVKWYASGQPSEVYFYKLTVGSPSTGSGQRFTETRKMVLLR